MLRAKLAGLNYLAAAWYLTLGHAVILAHCLDCGCHQPNDDHGDPRHIVLGELMAAAAASGISTVQAADNIVDTVSDIVANGPPFPSRT